MATRLDYFLNGMAVWKPSLYLRTKEKAMCKYEVSGVAAAAFLTSIPVMIVFWWLLGMLG